MYHIYLFFNKWQCNRSIMDILFITVTKLNIDFFLYCETWNFNYFKVKKKGDYQHKKTDAPCILFFYIDRLFIIFFTFGQNKILRSWSCRILEEKRNIQGFHYSIFEMHSGFYFILFYFYFFFYFKEWTL